MVSFRPEIPIALQLGLLLAMLGHFGNMSSYFNLSNDFGISDEGSILTCFQRVTDAILENEHELVCWPNPAEIRRTGELMRSKGSKQLSMYRTSLTFYLLSSFPSLFTLSGRNSY